MWGIRSLKYVRVRVTVDILQRKKEVLERLLNDNSCIPTDRSKLTSSIKKEKKFFT